MSKDEEIFDDENGFPWDDVTAARKNALLQRKYPIAKGKDSHLPQAKGCPKCAARPEHLAWFYFESPKWTWDNLCGRAGWMTVCDACHAQVDFFLEAMN